MIKNLAVTLTILSTVGCAPTISDQMQACLDAHYDDMHSLTDCRANAIESHNPNDSLARIIRANQDLYDAKIGVIDAASKAYKEGRISRYEHAQTLCALTQGDGCAEIHVTTPDGNTSDAIVEVR